MIFALGWYIGNLVQFLSVWAGHDRSPFPIKDDVAYCQLIMPDEYDGAVAQAFQDACEITLQKIRQPLSGWDRWLDSTLPSENVEDRRNSGK